MKMSFSGQKRMKNNVVVGSRLKIYLAIVDQKELYFASESVLAVFLYLAAKYDNDSVTSVKETSYLFGTALHLSVVPPGDKKTPNLRAVK